MEALYAKEVKKRKSKLSAEELELRREFLSQFKRNLEDMRKMTTKSFSIGAGTAADNDSSFSGVGGGGGGGASGLGFDTSSFFKNMPEAGAQGAGGAATGGGASSGAAEVELTDMQNQSLAQIKARDKQFDDILDQIGLAIERAGEQAKAIQDETQKQHAMLDNLEENLEKTRDKMTSVNISMKKSLEDSGAGLERFCTNCICCIILLGVVGLIINVVL